MGARAVCMDSKGNTYICEREGNGVRKVDARGIMTQLEAAAKESGSERTRSHLALARAAWLIETRKWGDAKAPVMAKDLPKSAAIADLFALGFAAIRSGNRSAGAAALQQMAQLMEAAPVNLAPVRPATGAPGTKPGRSADKQPPTAPKKLTLEQADPYAGARLVLDWDESTDNVGVVGYKIYRDNVEIGVVDDGSSDDTDTTFSPGHRYTYAVRAYDAAGNLSAPVEATISTVFYAG